MSEANCDIGLIGLAVMGQNLVLNMNDHGYKVAVFNRTSPRWMISSPMKPREPGRGGALGRGNVQAAQDSAARHDYGQGRRSRRPDHRASLPYLEKGDILIDGGNSLYTDTTRRTRDLAGKGILFIGTGVSGGEEGARFGPSIMPGGNQEAWPHVKDIFQAIAAKVEDGTPCCDWVGEEAPGTTSRWCTTASSTATCN